MGIEQHAPASVLYDTFQEEATHRKGREVEEWIRCSNSSRFMA
ncbi:MAG: hypothetical protein Q8N13_22585 [Acidovorax sp.]|nr:hypothetical protein [Acidovorax sp.]